MSVLFRPFFWYFFLIKKIAAFLQSIAEFPVFFLCCFPKKIFFFWVCEKWKWKFRAADRTRLKRETESGWETVYERERKIVGVRARTTLSPANCRYTHALSLSHPLTFALSLLFFTYSRVWKGALSLAAACFVTSKAATSFAGRHSHAHTHRHTRGRAQTQTRNTQTQYNTRTERNFSSSTSSPPNHR